MPGKTKMTRPAQAASSEVEPNSRIRFLGYSLDGVTAEQAITRMTVGIRTGHTCVHACLNASTVVAMRRDAPLAAAIQQADIVTADGQSIVWALRVLATRIPERVPATDLMERLIGLAEREAFGVYFLGSTVDVLTDLMDNVVRLHPTLRICGYHHGFYGDADEASLVDQIRNCRPDMLFVGMSSPRKELFMASHRLELEVPLMMGVGGAFEILAGRKKRAPAFVKRYGLEWLFRMMQEPRRLWRRYLIGNVVFTLMVVAELVNRRRVRR